MATEINLGKVKQTDSELEAKIRKIVGSPFDVLWQNPNPSNPFGVQIITLSQSINNYQFYSVTFKDYCVYSRDTEVELTTGLIRASRNTELFHFDEHKIAFRRKVYYAEGTLRFYNCYSYNLFEAIGPTENNNYLIPVCVFGYK